MSETAHCTSAKIVGSQSISKYKNKDEKKKARLARRKANKTKFCGKRGRPQNNSGYINIVGEGNFQSQNVIDVSRDSTSIHTHGKPHHSQDVPVPVTQGNYIENKMRSHEVLKAQPLIKHPKKVCVEEEHRNSIKKCRHLAVAVRREDRSPVDKALARLIRKRLTDLISEEVHRIITTGSSGWVIKFKQSGLVSAGFFLVTPANEEARDWLLSRDFGLLEGIKVVAKKLERNKARSQSQNK